MAKKKDDPWWLHCADTRCNEVAMAGFYCRKHYDERKQKTTPKGGDT